MAAVKDAPERRVTRALAQEAPWLPSLEEALDDMFGPRFEIPAAQPGLRVAGNWNEGVESDLGIRMGLVEAVIEARDGSTRGHARGFVMSRPGGTDALRSDAAVEAADTVNDEYMAAMLAMAAQGVVDHTPALLVVTGYDGLAAADRRRVLSGLIASIRAWEPCLTAIAIVVSPEAGILDRVARAAGVDRDTGRRIIEDIRRTELAMTDGMVGEAGLHLLAVGPMSSEEGKMGMGRFLAGEGAATVLAAPTSGDRDDVLVSAARMPVPAHLLIKFRSGIEGRPVSHVERIGAAMDLANAHVVAAGVGQPHPSPQPGRAINTTATFLATSLHMRTLAFDMAFQDRDVARMLTDLRDQDRVDEVFAAAATAPLDPGIGDMPRFLPEFREAIEDMILSTG